MISEQGSDLWEQEADALVITTNGFVKKNGRAVMGRGVALQAAQRWPDLPSELGALIRERGNHVMDLKRVGLVRTNEETLGGWITTLVSFPVKQNWWEVARPDLIVRSAKELVAMADRFGWKNVAMPRPGCGNGQLLWLPGECSCCGEGVHVLDDGTCRYCREPLGVKAILEELLDNRFTVMERNQTE